MKTLKISIIILLILIIVFAISIIFWKKDNDISNNTGKVINELETDGNEEEINDKIQKTEYDVINSAVTSYIHALNIENSAYYSVDENGKKVQRITDEQKKQNVIDLLSENYIKSNNITVSNLEKKVKLLDKQFLFTLYTMKRINNDYNVKSYVVYGIVETLKYEYFSNICLIVNIDNKNRTFSIEPTDEEYENINNLIKVDAINKNNNNQYLINEMTLENNAINDMKRYKGLALAQPELAYNYIDKEYSNKRFNTAKNYKEYIEKNRDEILSARCTQYLVNTYENYTEYVCKDQYENIYIFKETAPMEFTVTLDTYTLPNEKFSETYKTADENMKVMMNIDKWRQMINNRDYNAAYNVLDETFRQNNFGSIEKFEEYMRQNLPLHYKVDFGEFSNQGQNYVQEITLSDITGENAVNITKTIIMKIDENSEDFVMSFNV